MTIITSNKTSPLSNLDHVPNEIALQSLLTVRIEFKSGYQKCKDILKIEGFGCQISGCVLGEGAK
jgi:hypothetical protein